MNLPGGIRVNLISNFVSNERSLRGGMGVDLIVVFVLNEKNVPEMAEDFFVNVRTFSGKDVFFLDHARSLSGGKCFRNKTALISST